MEIIDNFGLPSKRNHNFNPWLEDLLDQVKSMSNKDFVLRLTGERAANTIIYHLHNNQNKTYATIYKRNRMIRLETFKRDLPDPEQAIKPAYQNVGTYAFDSTQEGVEMAALAIYDVLDQDTPYSLGEVTKIKVTPIPNNDIPWVFVGGRISGIVRSKDDLKITVENGKWTYTVPNEQAVDKKISVLKYIIFNDKGEFQLVSSSEFDFYFEMKYAT